MGRTLGHAVSCNLTHWQVLLHALYETAAGQAFSGSAVIDQHNTSGLFDGLQGGMVVVYTRASQKKQVQAIAYSANKGRKFIDY
jgi:levanase